MLRQKGRFSAFIIRLAVVATALSVAAMIASVAMISGFKYEIREKLFSYWGHVLITPYSPNNAGIVSPEPVPDDKGLYEQLKLMPEVTSVAKFAVRPAIVNANRQMEGVQLKGVDEAYDFSGIHAAKLDFSDSSYSKDIILSQTLLDRLQLKVGDDVLLYFLEKGSTFPRIRKVKVSGSYHTGMEDIDKRNAICDIRLLQQINNWDQGEINGYQLALTDDALADTVAGKVFYNYLPADSRLYPQTMQEIFPAIYDWLSLQDVNAMLALIIMAFVAIIDMIAALLILIVEQARMVGILKTMGMAEKPLRRVFLYHALFIGGMGVLLGNVLGLGLCMLQQQTGFLKLSEATYYMQYVPVRLIWWHPVLISIATLVLCILCMWLPTLYIRRILPARVLQFK
ncbi:MAG: ABC transporter permease [Chitinophagales bacterium]|nr:ABC transporter permease [Chitinophagaceae bacterium]MCB9065578.1 ABC transporter permease [Chitinophagales bacterium]